MTAAKGKINKVDNTPYISKDEDEARLLQLIEQAESRSVNEQ